MRARRVEVADAVHDGELALVPELLDGPEERRHAIVIVQPQDLVVANRDCLAVIAVERIVVRDDRVEIVVAARELDNDQHRVLLLRHLAFLRSGQSSCVT